MQTSAHALGGAYVDAIQCGVCTLRLRRTARMVRNGTRHHPGACAAQAGRETLWRQGRLGAHMRRMVAAAARARTEVLRRRLARLAPGVPFDAARVLYAAGYSAGERDRRRRRDAVVG